MRGSSPEPARAPSPPAAAPAPPPAPPAPPPAAAPAPAAIAEEPARAHLADTAELEKTDERHKAARRFARLAVSEIILYHEAAVREGRKAKDLWIRLNPDMKLCLETYQKRVPKEVRDQYDYLYDELVRQLAEGDPEKLGPGTPWSGTNSN
jgi:hypothetical protein